jgi:hypothetical protein
MRGNDPQQGGMFSYISPEQRVRKDHPLRPIRARVDQVLKELSPRFDKMYAKVGRPWIPPEQLLRAPEEEETHRRMLRLAEEHRAVAQTAAPRRTESGLDFLSRLRSLQSGARAKLDGCYRSGAVSPGRSVSEGCENADHEHPTTQKIAAKPTLYSEITQQGEKSARATQFFSGLLGANRGLGTEMGEEGVVGAAERATA